MTGALHPRRIFTRGFAAASSLALGMALFAAAPAQGQTVTLRMHTHVPPVASSYKNLKWWTQKVEKESGGKIKIQLFGSMQLGGRAADLYDQAKNGVVDIAWTLPGYKGGLFPRLSVFELPFIGAPARIASPAVDAFVRKWGKEEWGAVHVIVAHSAGESVLHSKPHPIVKLADFKGLKIRTPSRISSAALEALGATPVPIPGLKITEALLRNVVDGAVAPWSISLAIRTIDAAKFHTETTLHEPTLAMLMNKQSYARLPADLKKVIDANSGEWLAKEFGSRWEKDDKPGPAKAKKLGHPVLRVAPAELARWRKVSQPVYDQWVKDMNAKGLPGKQMLDDAERLIARYAAEDKAK
jgi:TRAP-type C4-dicarboxylate transport system substrate-binding protein